MIDIQTRIHDVCTCDFNFYDQLHSSENIHSIDKISDFLSYEENNIFFTGIGKSSYCAEYAASIFSSTGFDASYIDLYKMINAEGVKFDRKFQRKGSIIIFSKSGNSIELEHFLQNLSTDLKIYSVTNNNQSFLAKKSVEKICLNIKNESDYYKTLPFSTSIAMLSVSNILCSIAAEKKSTDKAEMINIIYKHHQAGGQLKS